MAEKYLGAEFDVHGGGLDLRFPHHENEQAQSRAAGDGFARYWLHNGWVTLGGEKMSKSLGNTALVEEVVGRVRPVELRYYLVAPHYRSTIEFTDEALAEAGAAYQTTSTAKLNLKPGASRPQNVRFALPAGSVPAGTYTLIVKVSTELNDTNGTILLSIPVTVT